MNSYSTTALLVCAVLVAGLAGQGAERAASDDTLRQFNQAVVTYTQLHRRLEQELPPMAPGLGPREIVASSDALAAALQAARVMAHEGDIFGTDSAETFRGTIARALLANGFAPEDVVTASGEEAAPEAPLPVVNQRFPWTRGAAMWPCVLFVLPSLPEELQYRIVGRDLVLVDVHANLVVDILRDALR